MAKCGRELLGHSGEVLLGVLGCAEEKAVVGVSGDKMLGCKVRRGDVEVLKMLGVWAARGENMLCRSSGDRRLRMRGGNFFAELLRPSRPGHASTT